jgi:hypothetical protein
VSLGWDTAPSCIQHDVPPADGIYKPFEKCADFFTLGPGSKPGTMFDGVSDGYLALVALGFVVMLAFLVAWVWLEDRKLRTQAAHLLVAGRAGQVELRAEVPQPGLGGPAA